MRKFKLKKHIGLILALTSAFLYAFNVIIEKNYITSISSESILFLMYFGAFFGLGLIYLFTKKKKSAQNRITKKEIPKVVIIVLCELFASLLMIEAVKLVDASVVSLLSVFEIVATAVIAYFLFKEPLDMKDVISILLMILACVILNFKQNFFSNISISSLLVIGGCICWGLENNVTASISKKEPEFFTSIKCGAVALLYLIIALIKGTFDISIPYLFIFGFFTYGLSILSYAISTKYLGANKATLIFSISPIFGVVLAVLIYHDQLTIAFLISIFIVLVALLLINTKDLEQDEEKSTQ
jgi:drug/metabolite transporter (DMT)-like permease